MLGVSGTDLAGAKKDCDAALKASKFTHQQGRILGARGLVSLKQSKPKLAWQDFDAAITRQDNDAGYFYGRGLAALRLKRTTEGEADIARAQELDPDIAEVWASYGLSP